MRTTHRKRKAANRSGAISSQTRGIRRANAALGPILRFFCGGGRQSRLSASSWQGYGSGLAKQRLPRNQVFDQDLSERFLVRLVKQSTQQKQADEQRQNGCDQAGRPPESIRR